MKFASTLDLLGGEIFASLNEKKLKLEKEGRQIYNMSVGTPDFVPPAHIVEALRASAADPASWKYSLRDLPELLSAVCDYYDRRFQTRITPDMIMSCYGTQEGCGHMMMALCDPGDTVLLPDPCYPVFQASAILSRAAAWYYPLTKETGFLPDTAGIPEEVARKAKLMIVNLPANPVGSVGTDAFYESLIAWAKKYDVLIVHDNAYSDILFTGKPGKSFLSYEGAREVGVEFFSLSKSFNVTGARISFLIGRPDVISAVRLLRTQIDFGMFIPIQQGAIAALRGPLEGVQKQCALYEERRNALTESAAGIGWEIPKAAGSMFVWAPLPEGYTDSMAFCLQLLEKAGVLCTPGASFGPHGEGYVRFALVLPPDKIREAFASIAKSGLI